jgi:hypothetical protein
MTDTTMRRPNADDRKIFWQQLSQAGWDVEGWDVARNAGVSVDLAAEAEYAGPSFALRLELLAEHDYLMFQISEPDGESLFHLRVYPASDLAPILARIIDVQDTLDNENYPSLVKSLIPFSDPLQIETDEGIFNLS